MSKNIKTKTLKAAIPILAAFGGNTLASNRGLSVSLSSKKGKNNSVIHVTDTDNTPIIPKLISKQKFPFSVFTNSKSDSVKSLSVTSVDAIDFLRKNNLLTSSANKSSNISGQVYSKNLSHDLTIRNNTNGLISCPNATYNIFSYTISTNNNTASCSLAVNSNTFKFGSNFAYCQNLHNQCMDIGSGNAGVGHVHSVQLPVELVEFDVE